LLQKALLVAGCSSWCSSFVILTIFGRILSTNDEKGALTCRFTPLLNLSNLFGLFRA